MSRKPRMPGGGGGAICGAEFSAPRREPPARSRVGGSGGSCIGSWGGRGLDLADGLFQRQPFAGDLGFAHRRLYAAQLRDQRGAGPLIKRAAALAGGTGVQSGNGTRNQRVIISHNDSTMRTYG